MTLAERGMSRFKAVVHRRFSFVSFGNVLASAVIVAAVAGLMSLLLGQDSNWDLRNYHLYGAYAYLTDRVGLDLAPAGMQSYFPPLLDTPYYWLSTHLPAALTAFLMGLWQGLSFIPLAGIAWKVLEDDPRKSVRAPLLGVAGILSAAFLSELGNTMGDASTAPWVLAALYLSLDGKKPVPLAQMILAGLCMGLAVGLKLTNSLYALALAASLLASDRTWRQRLGTLAVVTIAAMLTAALLTGAWFHQMWSTLGNPLLPQFNAWFQSPLASQTLVSDTRWLPASIGEAVVWPILMTLDPGRVGESDIRQVAWPLLQGLALCWVIKVLIGFRAGRAGKPMAPAQRQIIMFVGVAFAIWMLAFSIHRYLVAAEMLVPLAVWLLVQHVFAADRAEKIGKFAVVACALVAVLGWNTWGHAGLANSSFRVERPEAIDAPPATVLMTGQEPQAWMLPFLPSQYRYVGVGATSFPEGPAYLPRAQSIWETTPGRIFAILPTVEDRKQQRVVRINRLREQYGLGTSCQTTRWWAKRLKLEVAAHNADSGADTACELVLPAHARIDVEAGNNQLRADAAERLLRYSLRLHPGSCKRMQAWIGMGSFAYQWCWVSPMTEEGRD